MIEARIVSPRGSLYYAGESHPYDLETLWEHVRDVSAEIDPRDVCLEVLMDESGIDATVSAWVHRVAAHGIRVQLLFSHLPSAPAPPSASELATEPLSELHEATA